MSITPARQEQVDFTAPYSNSGLGVTASKTIAANLKWPEGYNDANVTFTCRRGVVGCKVIEERWPKATLRQFDDEAVAFQEVIDGKAHATVSSEPKPRFYTIQNPAKLFQPTTDYLRTAEEGMALRKGNAEAIAFFNDWIAKNQEFLKERHTYWFKTRATGRTRSPPTERVDRHRSPCDEGSRPPPKRPGYRVTPLDIGIAVIVAALIAFAAWRTNAVLDYRWNWSSVWPYVVKTDPRSGVREPNIILQGLATTLRLAVYGILIAGLIGAVTGYMRASRRLAPRLIAGAYVMIVRNIPPVVFVFIFAFFIASQVMPALGIADRLRTLSPTRNGGCRSSSATCG